MKSKSEMRRLAVQAPEKLYEAGFNDAKEQIVAMLQMYAGKKEHNDITNPFSFYLRPIIEDVKFIQPIIS